jgi:16S rRNA (guanine527-N7)-methyltransferase
MFPRAEVTMALESGSELFKLNGQQKKQCVDFIEHLARWNKVHNLTAVRDPIQMVGRHVLDSLTLLPFLNGSSVLDVGTGAGLPGIPLAIARPDLAFVLLDSNAKKLNFVEYVISTLPLKNVKAVHSRVEHYDKPFDCVVSRAFSSLQAFVESSGHLCQENGTLIAMKGPISAGELAALPDGYTIVDIKPVSVPNMLAKRFLVFIKRNDVLDDQGISSAK